MELISFPLTLPTSSYSPSTAVLLTNIPAELRSLLSTGSLRLSNETNNTQYRPLWRRAMNETTQCVCKLQGRENGPLAVALKVMDAQQEKTRV